MSDFDEAKKSIESLNFDMVIKKMVGEQKWSEPDAKLCAQLYRNFLFLKYKYGKKLTIPPNKEIDTFWHNHILDTRSYIKDCQKVFGEYLHHYPYAGLDGVTTMGQLKKYFYRVQELHLKEFGYYIFKIRLNIFELLVACIKILFFKCKQPAVGALVEN